MIETWLKERLSEAGYKLTEPRQLILDILRNTDGHLSAEEIYLEAISKNPSVGLATVYRTIDLFFQVGMLQKFEFGDGKARYELVHDHVTENHHHHLVCLHCKTIIDYDDFLDEELELMHKRKSDLSEKHGFKIINHTLHFYGFCENCQNHRFMPCIAANLPKSEGI